MLANQDTRGQERWQPMLNQILQQLKLDVFPSVNNGRAEVNVNTQLCGMLDDINDFKRTGATITLDKVADWVEAVANLTELPDEDADVLVGIALEYLVPRPLVA